MKRFLFLALVFCLLFSSLGVRAQDVKYQVISTYKLATDGTAEVNLTIQTSDSPTPTSLELPLVGTNIDGLSVKGSEDQIITSSVNESAKVSIPNIPPGANSDNTWKIVVNYKADIAKDFGTSKLFIVEPQDYGSLSIASESVSMDADIGLGEPIERGPKADTSSVSLGRQMSTWTNQNGQLTEAVGLVFGESAVSYFTANTTLKNDSWWWQTKEFVLPPDTNQQKVALNSIEPKPSEITLDTDGNIIAKYSLRPKGSVDVEAKGEVHNSNYSYSFSTNATLDDIPENIKNDYTGTNETWNGDQIELENVSTSGSVSKTVEDVYDGVVSQIPEEASGLGDATDWSNKLVGELRQLGVPARLVLGQSYTDGVNDFDDPKPHAWGEAYVPGTGWMTLDVMAGRAYDQFGVSDVQRTGLVLRGISPDYPPSELEAFMFSWTDEQVDPPAEATPTLSATNHMILPGVAIRSVYVDMGPGAIVDNAALSIDQVGTIKLGSLAPLQNSTTNTLALAGSAFSGGNVSYGILSGDTISQQLAEASTTTNYLPMIAILLFAIAVVGLVLWLRKRRQEVSDVPVKSQSGFVLATEEDGQSIEHTDLIPAASANTEPAPEPQEAIEQPEPVPVPVEKPEPKSTQSDTIRPTAEVQPTKSVGGRVKNPYKKTGNLIQ